MGDAGKVATDIFSQLSETAGDSNREARKVNIAETKSKWAQQLSSMDHEDDDQERHGINGPEQTNPTG